MFIVPLMRSNWKTQSTSESSPLSSMPKNRIVYCPSMVCSRFRPSSIPESRSLFKSSFDTSAESTFDSVPSCCTSGCHSFQYFRMETCWVVITPFSIFSKLIIGALKIITKIITRLTSTPATATAISRFVLFFPPLCEIGA